MTEAEWLACTDPAPMLGFLQGKTNERKLRLFACACTRLLWHGLPAGVKREAVEAGERRSDGLAREAECLHLLQGLLKLPGGYRRRTGRNWFSDQTPEVLAALFGAIQSVAPWIALSKIPDGLGWREHSKATGRRQPGLLRDIFGSLFRPVSAPPPWLVWNDGTIPKLAQAIYEERAFEWMSVLGDALEDADGTDPGILNHCRSDGPHVRGCWVVDLLLGKG